MPENIDKAELLSVLRAQLAGDLEAIIASQQESQAGATHAENKAEGDKDMRATEQSYLARGLAKRVGELRSCVSTLSTLHLRKFGPDSIVALTALVFVEDEEGELLRYFIAPGGGGVHLQLRGRSVSVITPNSPLGNALIGRQVDDEVELRTPQGTKLLTICEIL